MMHIKKLVTILVILPLCILPASASYSDTFNTGIDSVSGGEYNFGLGMFPVGTTFSFHRYFQMIPSYSHQARVYSSFSFSFRNSSFDNYDYFKGTPIWSMRIADRSSYSFHSGTYFSPTGTMDVYLQQPFGTNPVTGEGNLVTVRLGINSRYQMSLERLDVHRGSSDLLFSADYFKSESKVFPWLNGTRRNLNNYLYLYTYWYFYRDTGTDTYDGFYMELFAEAGPSWLGNQITPAGYTSSNYSKLRGYFEEKLTLFVDKQENGFNWKNMYVGHSNTIEYTFGDIVPGNKIPADRLRGYFSDRLWIHFTGPQFITSDCYFYFEISLNNHLFFGHVVNETSQSTRAVEYQSSISAYVNLKLFGFIHFEYAVAYNMARGIWAGYPYWSQGARLNFYVSL